MISDEREVRATTSEQIPPRRENGFHACILSSILRRLCKERGIRRTVVARSRTRPGFRGSTGLWFETAASGRLLTMRVLQSTRNDFRCSDRLSCAARRQIISRDDLRRIGHDRHPSRKDRDRPRASNQDRTGPARAIMGYGDGGRGVGWIGLGFRSSCGRRQAVLGTNVAMAMADRIASPSVARLHDSDGSRFA